MPTNDLSVLPIVYPVQSAQMVSFYNATKREGDFVILIWAPVWQGLQSSIEGDYGLGFTSEALAELDVPDIDGATYLVYDTEHWTRTPAIEQANPVGSVQALTALAQVHGLIPVVAPDGIFNSQFVSGGTPTTLYGRRFRVGGTNTIAPALGANGIYIVQAQRLQIISPAAFAWWVDNNARAIRAGNPDAKVYVQVSVDGTTLAGVTVQNAIDGLNAVTEPIDGIVVFCTPSSLTGLQDFLTLLGGPSPRGAAT